MFAQTLTTAAPSASREAATRVFSDEALIRQIAQGNKLAMRALFARHQVRVYRYALRIVRDSGLAEDVVSDVFFDAWQHAGRFEGRSTVSTWLLGIARHKALTACSRRATDAPHNPRLARPEAAPPPQRSPAHPPPLQPRRPITPLRCAPARRPIAATAP